MPAVDHDPIEGVTLFQNDDTVTPLTSDTAVIGPELTDAVPIFPLALEMNVQTSGVRADAIADDPFTVVLGERRVAEAIITIFIRLPPERSFFTLLPYVV
ncbi:MAG: hypothetical protein AAB817_02400 [Patescibacteria group bacterium]